jgi:chromosome segregation ATPase
MTDEEMQQTIQFILAEQAKVATGLEQVTENTAQLQRMMLSMTELFNRERKDLREKIAALADAQIRAEEQAQGFRREARQFRADVGQAMTMLENSQDRLQAAMIESQQAQKRAQEAMERAAEENGKRDAALSRMAEAITGHEARIGKLEGGGGRP